MKAEDVKTVTVIGAGTMGAGIAGEFARAGCDVRLTDLSEAILNRGMELADLAQRGLIDAGLVTERRASAALKRITLLASHEEACDGVDLLVEAVSEDLALKQKMFRDFDAMCPRRAVLASNTSGLSITDIAGATRRPTKVAGMHFWNPRLEPVRP